MFFFRLLLLETKKCLLHKITVTGLTTGNEYDHGLLKCTINFLKSTNLQLCNCKSEQLMTQQKFFHCVILPGKASGNRTGHRLMGAHGGTGQAVAFGIQNRGWCWYLNLILPIKVSINTTCALNMNVHIGLFT